jgi:hypothetical protein
LKLARKLIGTLLAGLFITTTAAAYDFDQHAWRDRLLVVAAPSAQHPDLPAQLKALRARDAALQDRRLRVFTLIGGAGTRDKEVLTRRDVNAVRSAFRIESSDAVMLLVGLDGGVKRRTTLDTDLSELFVQIDAMPMRRAEISAKRAAGEPVTEP